MAYCIMTKARAKLNYDMAGSSTDKKASIAFISHIVMGMPIVIDENIPTACTNGISLMYNPEWLKTLDEKYHQTVLLHEVLHVIGMHHLRLKGANPMIANIAADFLINWAIKHQWRFPLPESACYDHSGKYVSTGNETLEEVYAAIMADLPPPGGGDEGPDGQPGRDPSDKGGNGKGKGGFDPSKAGDSLGDIRAPTAKELTDRGLSGEEELKQGIKEAVQQAAMAARKKGDLPGHLGSMVTGIITPRRSLWDCLINKLKTKARDDYSWRRPNKTQFMLGNLLPGLYSEHMGPIVVAVDVSGSMGPDDYAKAQGGLNSLVDEFRPSKVTVLYCDTKVQKVEEFEPGDEVRIGYGHGGGTAFQPVFDWVSKGMDQEPELLIYFTDLYGDNPRDPGYDVVWVNTCHDDNISMSSSRRPKFGELVNFS